MNLLFSCETFTFSSVLVHEVKSTSAIKNENIAFIIGCISWVFLLIKRSILHKPKRVEFLKSPGLRARAFNISVSAWHYKNYQLLRLNSALEYATVGSPAPSFRIQPICM